MPSEPPPDETEPERLNRNFNELLQELRVSQNGTQILFAFLLTVPFSSRFSEVNDLERAIYYVALLTAALSAMLLIAPAAMHRILFRHHHKLELVTASSRLALGGQALLSLAVSLSVFLATDFIYNLPLAAAMSGVVLAWTAGLWFALPLYLRYRSTQRVTAEVTSAK